MAGQDKVAIVTGAGTGIGRAVSRALLEDGYAVALAGRRAGSLEETAEQAGQGASRALAVVTDVSGVRQQTSRECSHEQASDMSCKVSDTLHDRLSGAQ